jgi:hypothetical protein
MYVPRYVFSQIVFAHNYLMPRKRTEFDLDIVMLGMLCEEVYMLALTKKSNADEQKGLNFCRRPLTCAY